MKQKKITMKLEFSLRGKKRIPAVSFLGGDDYGVPLTSHVDVPGTPNGDAFAAFSKAAHAFCNQIKKAGELG